MGKHLDIDDAVQPYPEAKRQLAVMREAFAEMERNVEQLKRGEFICKKCGLRKDSEHEFADF